jgi:mannosyltransferase
MDTQVVVQDSLAREGVGVSWLVRVWRFWSVRFWFQVAAVVLAAGCLVVSAAGTWNVGFEGDEAATLAVIRMGWPELLSFTWGHSDAAHLMFYLLAKVWAGVFGQSELGLRSLVCVCLAGAVFVTCQVGRLLRGPVTGLVAGVVLLALPRATWGSLLARSYTLSMLLAVLSVWLLLVGLRRNRAGWWVLWAAVSVLSAWVYLYSLLLLPVFLVFAWSRRRLVPGLVWTVGAVVIGAVPVGWMVFAQRTVRGSWFAGLPVDWSTVLVQPFFVSVTSAAAVGWVLLLGGFVGLVWRLVGKRAGWMARLRALAASSLGFTVGLVAVPLVGLLAVDWLWFPVFYPNYLPYCVPAFALALALAAARLGDRGIAGVALVAVVVLVMPWTVNNKTWGNTHRMVGWVQTRDVVTVEAQTGDCLVTSLAGPRVRNPSRGLLVYRDAYASLRDLSLIATSEQVGSFYDVRRPVSEAVDGVVCGRLWFVAPGDQTADGPLNDAGQVLRQQETTAIQEQGYTLATTWELPGTHVELWMGKP